MSDASFQHQNSKIVSASPFRAIVRKIEPTAEINETTEGTMEDYDGMSPREGDQAAAAAEADFGRTADEDLNDRMQGLTTDSLEGTMSIGGQGGVRIGVRDESAHMRAQRDNSLQNMRGATGARFDTASNYRNSSKERLATMATGRQSLYQQTGVSRVFN